MPVLLYGSERVMWREEERSRIRSVHMEILRDLLGNMRMDRVLHECGVDGYLSGV